MKFKLFGRVFETGRDRRAVNGSAGSALPALQDDSAWMNYLQGQGYYVNAQTALKVSAVFRCVELIARTMASLPLHLFRETATGKERAKENPLYKLLYVLPNKHTTAYEFWHMYIVNLLLTRGAFARIVRSGSGRILALENIPTASVSGIHINEVSGERYIRVTSGDGAIETLRDGDFMYTPSLRFTSDTDPEDPIAIAADVLGLSANLNRFANATFRSGMHPGGFIEYPGALSDKAFEKFKEELQTNYAGISNAGKWLPLEQGAKAVQLERDMEKSQALESRKFAVVEICRMFGVPPHMAYDLDKATFSNIEQQGTEFVQYCLDPMCVRLEQTIFKDLLSSREQADHYAKFNVNGLTRGDMTARTAYFGMMRQNGVMNADEIRALEDMNDQPGGFGELYMVNGNMITVENAAKSLPKGAKQNA